ncbi:ABC transporter permease [Meiothermus granaticius]|uniref:Dipeptide transport system permease protein DppB n=1 Tax=Meiothermus granaticius NBRC 107808 TaxID=1227551 RepID=A0A399F5P0_9DEIN|nr:ABC transporter permease [Meiothermus granaticius]MCL6525455.1 ABC transporter permease [Thermaceae bacterium]RIH91974.1 Dipeptide transport system permease protein DppB [Meiothermus granaticius NBRC 107808]GEM87307.1 peptide ABC transporter permease [Meiothermus granaticius NBRC 107808]
MFAYTVRRLLQIIPLMFAASIVIFTLLALQPGDPTDELRQANPRITQEQLEALRHAYGLDQPIYIRYFKWLGRALQGDFGQSRQYAVPAAQKVFGERLPNTLILSGSAFLLALCVAIPVGIFSAVRQYSLADNIVTTLTFLGFSVPVFVLGIFLLYTFAVWLPDKIPGFPAFPPVAEVPYTPFSEVRSGTTSFWIFLRNWAWNLVLPVVALSLIQMASWTRFMRGSMLEVLNLDFVRTARSKGLSERTILYKHALRNALIPIVTLVGLSIPGVLAGAVVTESVFSYQGMGRLILDSLISKDYNVAMAALAMLALITAIFNLVADLLYAVVDPRIRYS